MALSQYSIVTEEEAVSFLGLSDEDRLVPGIKVWSRAASGETAATVEVTGGRTIVLIATGGTGAGTQTLDLTAAAYDTLTELAAFINASGGASPRWYARTVGPAGAESQDLAQTDGALNAAGVGNVQNLDMVDNWGLHRILEGATEQVEDFLQRQIVSRTYREFIDRREDNLSLWVRHTPLTSLTRVAYRDLPAVQITNSLVPPACAYATVEARTVQTGDNVLVLRVVGGASAGTDTIDLTAAASDPLSDLVTAINALGDGWSASLQDPNLAAYPAIDLLDFPAQRADSGTVLTLGVPDWITTGFITVANSGEIRRGTGWDWPSPAWTWLRALAGDALGFIPLPVWRTSMTSSGKRIGYLAEYTAGYPQASVPRRIKEAVLELVRMRLDYRKAGPSYASEGLGEYSYSRGGGKNSFDSEKALLETRLADERSWNFEQPV